MALALNVRSAVVVGRFSGLCADEREKVESPLTDRLDAATIDVVGGEVFEMRRVARTGEIRGGEDEPLLSA
jgi:hypothetical protein